MSTRSWSVSVSGSINLLRDCKTRPWMVPASCTYSLSSPPRFTFLLYNQFAVTPVEIEVIAQTRTPLNIIENGIDFAPDSNTESLSGDKSSSEKMTDGHRPFPTIEIINIFNRFISPLEKTNRIAVGNTASDHSAVIRSPPRKTIRTDKPSATLTMDVRVAAIGTIMSKIFFSMSEVEPSHPENQIPAYIRKS